MEHVSAAGGVQRLVPSLRHEPDPGRALVPEIEALLPGRDRGLEPEVAAQAAQKLRDGRAELARELVRGDEHVAQRRQPLPTGLDRTAVIGCEYAPGLGQAGQPDRELHEVAVEVDGARVQQAPAQKAGQGDFAGPRSLAVPHDGARGVAAVDRDEGDRRGHAGHSLQKARVHAEVPQAPAHEIEPQVPPHEGEHRGLQAAGGRRARGGPGRAAAVDDDALGRDLLVLAQGPVELGQDVHDAQAHADQVEARRHAQGRSAFFRA